jgi:hypothetical protein
MRGEGGEGGQGGEMVPAMYAHMSKWILKKKENVVFIYTRILFSHKEEWNFVVSKEMDGTS